MKIVDITHCDQSDSLNARKIWAMLYPEFIKDFKPGQEFTTHDFDSFLCDLRCFERILKESNRLAPVVMYWEHDHAYTNVATFDDGMSDFRITVDIGTKIVIEHRSEFTNAQS